MEAIKIVFGTIGFFALMTVIINIAAYKISDWLM